jgi:septation ring formation regulator EzrA
VNPNARTVTDRNVPTVGPPYLLAARNIKQQLVKALSVETTWRMNWKGFGRKCPQSSGDLEKLKQNTENLLEECRCPG